MKFNIIEGQENYAARIVKIDNVRKLDGCDNVQGTTICGADVIVGNDVSCGDVGVFFPCESKIDSKILSRLNLYSSAVNNADQTKKGYFGDAGRVKAVKFRGHPSNGFWLPLRTFVLGIRPDMQESLVYELGKAEGTDFHTIEHEANGETFHYPVCKKYISPQTFSSAKPTTPNRLTKAFQFHYSTPNFHRVSKSLWGKGPAYVSIKFHGTSAIVANLPIKQELNLFEKFGNWIQKKFNLDLGISETKYSLIWASRTVIKGIDGLNINAGSGYYSTDVWGEVADTFRGRIPEGYTVYGEIIGWAGDKPIQKGYTYGIPEGEWRFVPYRITFSDKLGTLELQPYQFDEKLYDWFDVENPLELPKDYWIKLNRYSLVPQITEESLKDIQDCMVNIECPFNPGKPAEGVVIRLGDRAVKIKNKAFLEYESKALDKGEVIDVE